MADVKEKMVTYCGTCGLVWDDPVNAAKCCTCSECGLPVEKNGKNFTGLHRDCYDRRRAESDRKKFEAAEKLEDWDGPVIYGQDRYFEDLDSLLEYLEDTIEAGEAWPEYVHVCAMSPFPKLELEDVLQGLVEDHDVEDFETDDIDVPEEVMAALEKSVGDFNAATAASRQNESWHEDPRRMIRVPPRPREAA